MKAEIKYFYSPDVENLESWIPEATDYRILLQIMVSSLGVDGEESFDLEICSLAWVEKLLRTQPVFDTRHTLIVQNFHWPSIESYIRDVIDHWEAPTWEELALLLGRLGKWEFEDYIE
ncbi:MAG: immunity 8 family protein [Propionibacteriaceae bacterium]|jgi:hypothetical protein|nr:immunity 8 family protein [Propionibacteriaceae bacterium]